MLYVGHETPVCRNPPIHSCTREREKYPCNKNQLDALFILSLFCQSTSTCFEHICGPSSGGILYIQGVSRLVVITAGGDFLGLCDKKSSLKHVSDFGRLRSYDRLKLRIEGNDY